MKVTFSRVRALYSGEHTHRSKFLLQWSNMGYLLVPGCSMMVEIQNITTIVNLFYIHLSLIE